MTFDEIVSDYIREHRDDARGNAVRWNPTQPVRRDLEGCAMRAAQSQTASAPAAHSEYGP